MDIVLNSEFCKASVIQGLKFFNLRVFWWQQGGNGMVIHSSRKEKYTRSLPFVRDRKKNSHDFTINDVEANTPILPV